MLSYRLWLLVGVIVRSVADEDNDPELGEAIEDLIQTHGDKLFQDPSPSTGEKVAKWNKKSGVNPEELGEYPEGDILFPPRESMPMSRHSLRSAKRWKAGIVPYVLSSPFSDEEQSRFKEAFAAFAEQTCIVFVPRTTENDYLKITGDKTGCWSHVGRLGGAQQVNLQIPECVYKGTITHELMHSLGFLHEQNRYDRDNYVKILFENIKPAAKYNFVKKSHKSTNTLGVDYDYESVMHYTENAFNKNGKPTIVAKQEGVKMGQRSDMSPTDIIQIRRLYKCKHNVTIEARCR